MAAFRSQSTATRTSFRSGAPTGRLSTAHRAPTASPRRSSNIKATSFTIAYHEGQRRVRQKFSDLTKAKNEASLAAIKLANGESEALKLKGHDRTDYVRAIQKLREWKPDADLNLAITDYVAAARRLPEHTSPKEAVDFYLKRHPIGLPQKSVQEVVDELVESKEKSGKSEIYTRKMR